jgi:hypothetical protein
MLPAGRTVHPNGYSPFEGQLLTCAVIQRSDTKIGSEGSYGTSG